MKKIVLLLIVILLHNSVSTAQSNQSNFPKLSGPYLGQKAPGIKPEVFAPGIVSVPDVNYTTGSFSGDGKEFYFYRWNGKQAKIICSKIINETWTVPEELHFIAKYAAMEPHITFNGKFLYFIWENHPSKPGYYVSERTPNGWSEPKYAGDGMFISSSKNGQLYVTDMSSLGANGKTYLSKVSTNNGVFTGYEKLEIQPHLGEQAHPCIAPDESYILFDVEGGSHLFVSFKKKDGSWGQAIDLSAHGIDKKAGAACVSPDGKYLFFNLGGNYMWVDIKVIEDLRPKE